LVFEFRDGLVNLFTNKLKYTALFGRRLRPDLLFGPELLDRGCGQVAIRLRVRHAADFFEFLAKPVVELFLLRLILYLGWLKHFSIHDLNYN